jgi:type II secretory pathway pseudopilin PulG
VLFAVGIIGVLSAIAVPQLTIARQAAMSGSAIATLRIVNSAQMTFALTCGSGFFAPNLTTLGTRPLGGGNPFVGPDLGSANSVEKSGYTIQVAATALADTPASCNGLPAGQAAASYRSGADSLFASNPRFFASNTNGTIFEHTASIYGVMPELGNPPVGQPVLK